MACDSFINALIPNICLLAGVVFNLYLNTSAFLGSLIQAIWFL